VVVVVEDLLDTEQVAEVPVAIVVLVDTRNVTVTLPVLRQELEVVEAVVMDLQLHMELVLVVAELGY
jgi:hypothetical protein